MFNYHMFNKASRRIVRTIRCAALVVTALLVIFTFTLPAQVPADSVFRGFHISGEFLFDLDSTEKENAEIYFSESAAAYLIIVPDLASALLIGLRDNSVESLSPMKIVKRSDGSVDILADAAFSPLGSFSLDGQTVVFKVNGKPARIRPKPPLLGVTDLESLRDYRPDYARTADAYSPDQRHLEFLKAQTKDVRILIYFGTWCHVCGRLVPRVMKVEKELGGSGIRFQYYGLPQPLMDDPKARLDQITGIPTGIVYMDGKESRRLSVSDLDYPEQSFRRLFGPGQ